MIVREAMQTAVVTIQADDRLPAAVMKMGTLEARRLLVTDGERLVGLLTAGEITRALQKSSGPQTPWGIVFQAASVRVRDVMTSAVYTAQESDDLSVALAALLEHHVGGLPVVNVDGELKGMLSLTDVLRAAASAPQANWGRVRDWMSADVLSVTPELPLSEAAARLTVSHLRVMPVVAGLATGARELVGVLHQLDIRAAITRAEDGHGPTIMGDRFFLGGQTVRDLMRSPEARISAEAPLSEAVQVMLRAEVHGLPVVDGNGGLVGVVTVSDVLRALLGRPVSAPTTARSAHV